MTLAVPLWALLGLLSAVLSALVMLLQERLKLNGYALAVWNKFMCVVLMVPFIAAAGLPPEPLFYLFLFLSALLWAVSDVVFFTALPRAGAGMVSRILPVTVVVSFILWFAIDWSLFDKYAQTPVRSAAITVVLCATAWFATRLKRCPVSWDAVRILWFVIFACVAGPLVTKLATQQADLSQGPAAYVFCEAAMMIALWAVYGLWKRPVGPAVLFNKKTMAGGALIGSVSALAVLTNVTAFFHVDNPAFIPAVKFLDTFIILLVYKLTRRKEDADVAAGVGIVVCAALLILLKSWSGAF